MIDPKAVLEFYVSDKFNPILPPDIQQRHFRFRIYDGMWRKVKEKIYSADDLKKAIAKYGGVDLYYSTSKWLNPNRISGKGHSGSYFVADNLLLGNDLTFDLDAEAPITLKSLDKARLATKTIFDYMKTKKEFDLQYCAFSIVAGTPILTKRGLIPIEAATKGDEVLSFDGKVRFASIYDTIAHEEEIYELSYQKCKTPMQITGDHSVYRWSMNGIECIGVKNLNPGDFLISFNSIDENEKIPIIQLEFKWKKKNRVIHFKPDKEAMRLIGYYLSQGSLSKRGYGLFFAFNKNEDYFKDCKRSIHKCIKRELPYTNKTIHISESYSSDNCIQLRVSDPVWYCFLLKEFKKLAKFKRLPSWCFLLPRDYKLELLYGVINGDGGKTKKYDTKIKLANKELVTDLIWLAKSIGLAARYGEEKCDDRVFRTNNKDYIIKGGTYYFLTLNKSEIYGIEQGPCAPKPKEHLYPLDGLKYICSMHNIKLFYKNNIRKIIHGRNLGNAKILRQGIRFVLDNISSLSSEDNSIINNYISILTSNLCFIKVQKVVKTNVIKKVYDISVKDTECFFSGQYPILLHNSGSKGFRLVYSPLNSELPADPHQRFDAIERKRKLFIQDMLNDIKKSNLLAYRALKAVMDDVVTFNPMCVIRVLGSVNSSTGFLTVPIKPAMLTRSIKDIIKLIPYIGEERPVIPSGEMTVDGGDSPPSPRLLQCSKDVSGLASLPHPSVAYFITNRVLGIRKGFIPIFIYQHNQNFENEVRWLQDKFKLGNLYVYYYEDRVIVMSLKVMQRRQLQKVLNKSSSRTKYDFLKYRRIFAPFSMTYASIRKGNFTGHLSTGHFYYVHPQGITNQFFCGWPKIELVRAERG